MHLFFRCICHDVFLTSRDSFSNDDSSDVFLTSMNSFPDFFSQISEMMVAIVVPIVHYYLLLM